MQAHAAPFAAEKLPPAPARAPFWVVLTLVLAGHATVLTMMLALTPPPPGPSQQTPGRSGVTLVARQQLAPAPAPAPTSKPRSPEGAPATPVTLRLRAAAASAAMATRPTAAEADLSSISPVPDREDAAPAPPAPFAPSAPPPIYATRPAPASTLHYNMTQAGRDGQATLRWQPDSAGDDRYQLSLQTQLGGQEGPGWTSSGSFDAAGLAPQRFTSVRRQRVAQATNFRRDADIVSYSAQTGSHALTPGLQDRGSWLLQLGAILQANPDLAQAGAVVTLAIAGTQGAPEHWQFNVLGRAPLRLDSSGTTVPDTVHLKREPQRPYDLRVQVWLDPARHHLPLKWLLEVQGSEQRRVFELRSPP